MMNKAKINILFMGTTDFSQAILKHLLTMPDKFNIVGVVCQPDRIVGRKKQIVFSPVKQTAIDNNLQLFQPEKIINELEKLQQLNSDIIITCAYGQFLPSPILALPKIIALNIHASLLPALRGGAPIQWAIIKNLKHTGITLMKMVRKMDAGAIFCQEAIDISPEETYQTLKPKLITLAILMLNKYLINIINNEIIATEQDESQVTFGLNITREDELINWNQAANLVSCHIRGLYDIPIAYTNLNNHIYKIHQIAITDNKSLKKPGTITNINKLGIFVATTDYDIIIKQIQPAGKQVIAATNYFGSKDLPLAIGMVFN